MWVVDEKNGKTFSLPASEVTSVDLKRSLSPLAWRIITSLSEKPMYPKELGKKLKVNEQKIYYHIRNLEKAGLVSVVDTEMKKGAIAKIYSTTSSALVLLLKPLEHSPKILSLKDEHRRFLEPFIEDGKLNALIVIGSSEPHGPTKVRGKDGPAATNLGLFLGTFLTYIPDFSIKTDTEIREEDLKKNLILVGGPGVNSIVNRVNSRLPISFKQVKYQNNYFSGFHSSITGKIYSEESCGIIEKIKSPFEKNKDILVIAGRRANGTNAAVLALMKMFDEVCKGNAKDRTLMAKAVDGIDSDNDGIVDSVEILE